MFISFHTMLFCSPRSYIWKGARKVHKSSLDMGLEFLSQLWKPSSGTSLLIFLPFQKDLKAAKVSAKRSLSDSSSIVATTTSLGSSDSKAIPVAERMLRRAPCRGGCMVLVQEGGRPAESAANLDLQQLFNSWNSWGGFLKWGYPQSSSILDWDFPL